MMSGFGVAEPTRNIADVLQGIQFTRENELVLDCPDVPQLGESMLPETFYAQGAKAAGINYNIIISEPTTGYFHWADDL